jgi:S1-C subfamily serine protease
VVASNCAVVSWLLLGLPPVLAVEAPSSEAISPAPVSATAPALMYDQLSHAVVGITCRRERLEYFGTGTIIDPAGLVLTSVTVVPEGASRILVYLRGGRIVPGRVKAWQEDTEFALIQIDRPDVGGSARADAAPIRYVAMGSSARARLGESVYVLGNAFRCIIDDDRVAMSGGIVSGLYSLRKKRGESTYLGPIIETNAPVNNGMDGGPLVDARGRLLGVISLNYSRNRWLGTVVPIDRLKPLVSTHRGWFSDEARDHKAYAGMELEEVAGSEIRVLGVAADGPAARAGLRVGSRIVKVNGEAASSLKAFIQFFTNQRPSQRLVLETVSDGEPSTVEITLWARL